MAATSIPAYFKRGTGKIAIPEDYREQGVGQDGYWAPLQTEVINKDD